MKLTPNISPSPRFGLCANVTVCTPNPLITRPTEQQPRLGSHFKDMIQSLNLAPIPTKKTPLFDPERMAKT